MDPGLDREPSPPPTFLDALTGGCATCKQFLTVAWPDDDTQAIVDAEYDQHLLEHARGHHGSRA